MPTPPPDQSKLAGTDVVKAQAAHGVQSIIGSEVAPGLRMLPFELLEFDTHNPRFVNHEAGDVPTIIRGLIEHADLEELLRSIAENGYLAMEPLIVTEQGATQAGHFLVLEGNRRLAAVTLLRGGSIADDIGITLPAISDDNKRSTDVILCKIVTDRNAARAFVGYKHVNGPNKWDSIAKAKFAADWIVRDHADVTIVSRTLGDTYNTVRRLVFGWLVLNQAEDNGFGRPTATTRKFSFSHLYTALGRAGFRQYLGLTASEGEQVLGPNPVAPEKITELRQVITWLFGDKPAKKAPVIRSQNPDLNRLNDVLLNDTARRILLARNDLDDAYRELVPPSAEFTAALIDALASAQAASALVSEYDGDRTLIETGERLVKTSMALRSSMNAIIQDRSI